MVTAGNVGTKPGRLTIAYMRADGGRFNAFIAAAESPVKAVSALPRGGPIVKPGQSLSLQLEFTLPRGESPNWLDGSLVMRLHGTPKGSKDSSPAIVAPVQAEFQSLDGVTFEPNPLALQVTGGDLESGDTVNLMGPGAEALVDRNPPFSESVLLGNEEGHRVSVTLEELRRIGDGEVAGTISVGDASPGEYKGTLVLGPGEGAPDLPITLHARRALIVAIGLVLLSSILGGLLPAFSVTARTRALLRTRLKNAIERLEGQYDSAADKPQLLWDMTLEMGPRPWLERKWTAVSQVEGVAGLYTNLKRARSDDDLEDLAPEVDAAISTIDRWLLVFGPARELQALFRRRGVPDRKGAEWSSTKLATVTEEFLEGLRRATPKTDADARTLAAKCIEHRRWYVLVLEAWTKVARAEADPKLSETARIALGLLDLSAIIDADSPAYAQSEAGMSALYAQLSQLMRDATKLVPTLDRYADAPTAETFEAFLASAELVTEEPPDLWAGIADESQELESHSQISTQPSPSEQLLQRLYMLDWLITIVLAVGATLAYTAPLYDSTWGTETDLLTALAVGFGTQVVVQWGAMPIFRSVRSAKTGGDTTPADPQELQADART